MSVKYTKRQIEFIVSKAAIDRDDLAIQFRRAFGRIISPDTLTRIINSRLHGVDARAAFLSQVRAAIGSERRTSKGYIEICIAHNASGLPVYEKKHIVEWEKVNGKMPANHLLYCLGERADTSPANWVLATREQGCRAMHMAVPLRNADPAMKLAMINLAKLKTELRHRKAKRFLGRKCSNGQHILTPETMSVGAHGTPICRVCRKLRLEKTAGRSRPAI